MATKQPGRRKTTGLRAIMAALAEIDTRSLHIDALLLRIGKRRSETYNALEKGEDRGWIVRDGRIAQGARYSGNVTLTDAGLAAWREIEHDGRNDIMVQLRTERPAEQHKRLAEGGRCRSLHERPLTRSECANTERPCPYVSCRYHLFLEVTDIGTIKWNVPGAEDAFDSDRPSCALDVASSGERTLEEVAAILSVSRERVRQVVNDATSKLLEAQAQDLCGFSHVDGPVYPDTDVEGG